MASRRRSTVHREWPWLLLLLGAAVGVSGDEGGDRLQRFRVEGRVAAPDDSRASDDASSGADWLACTRLLVNGGERLAFLREDGSFTLNHLPTGSYVLEVSHPDYVFEPARIDINSKGKIRARKVNYVQTSSVVQVPYPLRFKARGPHKYFQIREQWRVTDFLFNPMVLMMVLPLLLIMLIPKMMNAADPETQREMQQSLNMPKYDVPELSEMMTSLFAGGKKPAVKQSKASKKKQQ